MYNIVLGLILNASSPQINQEADSSWQQRKVIQLAQNDVQEVPVFVPKKKSGDNQDIIEQLKQQNRAEEDALKPDLESFGLDQIDAALNPSTTAPSTPTSKTATSKTPTAPVSLTPPAPPIPSVPKPPVVVKNLADIKAPDNKVTSKDLPKTSDDAKKINSAEDKQVNAEPKKDSKILDIIAKPIDKIKELIADKTKEELPKSEAKPKEQKPVLSAEEKKKIEERKKQELAKRIALLELRQKQRAEKLENLRQKYLREDISEGGYEGINRYQAVSIIVPKPKIPPKFMNTQVPPPLLNRFYQGDDNKHHPVIISKSEKINFMFQAIAENRIEEFGALYALVKDPNIKNSSGDTLLTFAMLMKRYDAVFSLLSKGADPDMPNDLGYTPLNIAIEMADYKLASILIDMGARVDLIDDFGRSYLMESSRVGSLPITDLLIRKGVDVNIADRNGTTALAIAYKHKKDIIAKYLLKYGARSWIQKDYNDDDSSMIEELFEKWK